MGSVTSTGAFTYVGRLASALSTGSTYGVLTNYPLTNEGCNDATKISQNFQDLETLLAAHHTRHENGGADEINVAGLSGLLADPQTPIAHDIFSAYHGDTTGAASPVDGDTIIGNATPKWSKLAISIPAANVRNVLGVDNGELRPSWKTALDGTAPANIQAGTAAAAGTSLVFSHRDHVHKVTLAATSRMLGRGSAGAGDMEEMTISSAAGLGLTYGAGTLQIGATTDVVQLGRLGLGAAADGTASLVLTTVADAAGDVDKFLVLDAGNRVDYRTGAETLSDIGAQPLDADLTAIAALAGTGVLCHTGAGTWAERTVTSTCGFTVTNPGGVAGNIDIGLTSDAPQLGSISLGRAATVTPIDCAKTSTQYLRYDTYGSYSYWQMRRSNGSTIGTPETTDDGDVLGRIDTFGVTDGAPDAFPVTASTILYFVQDGASSATHVPGRISMYTSTDAALAERVRIASSGNITLNYASTDSDLTVNWDSGTALFVQGSDGVIGIGTTTLSAWKVATFPSVIHLGSRAVMAGDEINRFYIGCNTFYDSADDRWEINTGVAAPTLYYQDGSGGSHIFYVTNSGASNAAITWYQALSIGGIGSQGLVINESGQDLNTRVEGDANQYLIFADAGLDMVAIGHDTPDRLLHSAIDTATTNAEVIPLRLTATCSGTVDTGFAVGMEFEVENSYADVYAWSVLRTNYISGKGGDIGVDIRCMQDTVATTYISCLPDATTYGDYLLFEKMFRSAVVAYKDINVGGMLLSKPASSAPGTDTFMEGDGGDTGVETYAFAPGEYVSGAFEIQHDYKEGTNLVFHIHWQGIDAPTGTDKVQWQVIMSIGRDETTPPNIQTLTGETDFDTQYEFKRTDVTTIDGSNSGPGGTALKVGDQLFFKLSRINASSAEYAGDALISTVGVHYQVDTLGSRSITSKW